MVLDYFERGLFGKRKERDNKDRTNNEQRKAARKAQEEMHRNEEHVVCFFSFVRWKLQSPQWRWQYTVGPPGCRRACGLQECRLATRFPFWVARRGEPVVKLLRFQIGGGRISLSLGPTGKRPYNDIAICSKLSIHTVVLFGYSGHHNALFRFGFCDWCIQVQLQVCQNWRKL